MTRRRPGIVGVVLWRLFALAVGVGGPTITSRSYRSAKNAIALCRLAYLRPPSLVVGNFAGGPGSPDRQSFAAFVRGAFIHELSLGGLAGGALGKYGRADTT